MNTLAILLTAHFVGDFVGQSNGMALNKSKTTWAGAGWLTWHVTVYSLAFVPVLFFLFVTSQGQYVALQPWQAGAIWKFLGLTFVSHWLTDFCTSRITASLWFLKLIDLRHSTEEACYRVTIDDRKRHWFFVAVGFDQLIHVWTIYLSFWWVTQ